VKKMTSRQRLLAASRQEPVDMIPLAPRVGYAARFHYGTESPQNCLRLKKKYDYDPFLTVNGQDLPLFDPFNVFRYAPGVEVEFNVKDQGSKSIVDRTIHTPDGDLHDKRFVVNPGHTEYGMAPEPVHSEFMVKTSDDLPKLKHLLPPVNASLADEYHGWEYVAGQDAVTRACVYGPLGYQADMVMSHEDLMVNYMINRDFVVELVNIFFQNLQAQIKALLEQGVRYFYSSWFAHSLSVGWSPSIFRQWFLPMIKAHVDLIHSYEGIVDYYDDGKHMNILEMLLEAKVNVVETCTPPPVGDVNLEEAKKICGKNMTLMGHTDLIYVIKEGTVDDVKKAVEYACRIGGNDGCFILGTSDSIREGTPIENIDAYFQYAREYGKTN